MPAQPRRRTSKACARSRAAVITIPRRRPGQGIAGLLRSMPPATSSGALPYAVGKYRSAAYAARVRELLDDGRFDLVVCDFLPPAANLPGPPAVPGGPLHAQRGGRDLAAARRDRALAGAQRLAARVAVPAHAAVRGRTPCGGSISVLAVSEADERDALQRLYGPLRTARARRADRRRHASTSCRRTPRRAAAPPRLHRVDGLAAERGRRCCYFVRDILPLIRAGRAERDAVDRRPRADAGRPAARPTSTASHVTGRVDDVRPHMRGGRRLHRAAAHRRAARG